MLGKMIEQIAGQADETAKLRTTVAELVALLRMGRELARAAERAENFTEAYVQRERIFAMYDAAIAKHGSA